MQTPNTAHHATTLEPLQDDYGPNRYRYLDSAGEHLHEINVDGAWRPLIGTSRVGSVIAKPLTWWASGLAVQTFGCPDAKMLTKIKRGKATREEIDLHVSALSGALKLLKLMNVDEYSKLIDEAYRAHDVQKRSRAKTGTDLHAECEKFVRYHMQQVATERVSPLVWPQEIRPFVDWAHQNVKRFLWSEGHCYSEKHWLGGISDAGYQKNDGTYGIIDFKSSKDAYMEQFWQCAGYAIQIEENGVFDAQGNQLHGKPAAPFDEVCIFPFGAEKPAPQFNVDMAGSKEAFLAELLLYSKMPKE
jgi:hypothetical protein